MNSVFAEDKNKIIRCNANCAMRSGKRNGCRVMQDELCFNAAKCSFHQTQEEREASIAAFNRRMNGLTFDEQIYYAGKYYRGKMPWKQGRG